MLRSILDDHENLSVRPIGLPHQLVTVFVTKMWYVDQCRRVVGDHTQDITGCKLAHLLPDTQDRKRTSQPQCINVDLSRHGWRLGRGLRLVHSKTTNSGIGRLRSLTPKG